MSDSFYYTPRPKEKELKKKRWNIPSILWKIISRTCMALGAMVLISAIMGVFLTTKLMKNAAPPLPNEMVLVLKMENGLTEIASTPTLLEPFPFDQPTIRQVIDTLDQAAKDDRVKSFVLNYKGGAVSLTHIQELRPAIARFRSTGKKAIIYGSSFASGAGTGLGTYYLASSFDEIWMQPVGMLSIAGINMEMPFARQLLDKIGVTPQFFQREEYKSAMENLTNSEMSAQNREMIGSIVQEFTSEMVMAISKDREITPAQFKLQVDKGMLTGEEALEAKLIDRLDYGDVLMEEVKTANNQSIEFIKFSHYANKQKIVNEKAVVHATNKKEVALIYIAGTIIDVSGSAAQADAGEITAAINEATESTSITDIIVRIDSPGGSPTASETIRRALVKAQEKGKRIIVSMGPMAASGGYWIAAPADKIYALPSTLTGSIGVVMGKFELSALFEKLGVNWANIQWGENADMLSITQGFDEQGTQRMNALIDSTYNAFLSRVAQGRKMEISEVRKIAKGRAWTGSQAVKIGLVDEIGGLDDALNFVAKEYNLSGKDDLKITVMPKPKSPIEQFLEAFSQQVALGHFLKQNTGVLETLGNALGEAEIIMNAPAYGVYEADFEALR
ncbi:MAG: signal peptide peptidase SppA [Alphaproteobacteria bacterium]|nr:signal peptide peptidase SppA [Alphaproteobacteria bacterium]NCQ88289.1 signal peptide peptidase SppA [Alphaproteobacteria bacterium]NCT05204.1 signal peptide peptidase SppA [Alphaproteobacteria bacterium]